LNTFIEIEEYIILPLCDRQTHIDENESCIERGGNSTHHKGVLAQYLNTKIPNQKNKVDLCHYCGNSKCSNPKHLYWGTRSENIDDSKRHGTYKSPFDRLVEKYGYEEACKINAKNGHQKGNKRGTSNKNVFKTEEHRKKISTSIQNLHNQGIYDNVNSGKNKAPE